MGKLKFPYLNPYNRYRFIRVKMYRDLIAPIANFLAYGWMLRELDLNPPT